MKITYDFDLNDWLAFNKYHYQKNRKNTSLKIRWVVTILVLGYIVFCYVTFGLFRISVFYFLSIYIIIGFILDALKIEERITMNYLKKHLTSWSNASILWKHSLELKDDYIELVGPWTISKTFWDKIDKIAENDNYIFIYVTSVSSIAIPMFKLSEWVQSKIKKNILKQNKQIDDSAVTL